MNDHLTWRLVDDSIVYHDFYRTHNIYEYGAGECRREMCSTVLAYLNGSYTRVRVVKIRSLGVYVCQSKLLFDDDLWRQVSAWGDKKDMILLTYRHIKEHTSLL